MPGAGGRSPARRGAGGERGLTPLHPPHPPTPRNPGTRKVSFPANSPPPAARCKGHRRGPSRPFGPGDVRACSGAPSALRASGIAFAPAPRCIIGGNEESGPRWGGNNGEKSTGGEGADGEKEKKQRRPARSEGNNRVFLRNDRPSLFPLFMYPGDGGQGESVCASARFHPPE